MPQDEYRRSINFTLSPSPARSPDDEAINFPFPEWPILERTEPANTSLGWSEALPPPPQQQSSRPRHGSENRMPLRHPDSGEFYCENCSATIAADGEPGYYCRPCNNWRCEDCGPCRNRRRDDVDDDGVHQWNYRPRHFRPKGNFKAEPLLGVELEVGGRRQGIIADVVRRFDDTEDHLYLKHDGSISGVEIVTHPMTLTYAREFDFDGMLAQLRRLRCRVDDSYGLHVHVSRNAFRKHTKANPLPWEDAQRASEMHTMMWLAFMMRNAENLKLLARRTNERYAAFMRPRKGELKRKAQGQRDYDDSRYVAVNCNNDRTIELRFFRATLNYQEFMAALEFADASVRYTADITTSDVLRGGNPKALTWKHFAAWVAEHDYTNLAKEIDKVGSVETEGPLNRYDREAEHAERRHRERLRRQMEEDEQRARSRQRARRAAERVRLADLEAGYAARLGDMEVEAEQRDESVTPWVTYTPETGSYILTGPSGMRYTIRSDEQAARLRERLTATAGEIQREGAQMPAPGWAPMGVVLTDDDLLTTRATMGDNDLDEREVCFCSYCGDGNVNGMGYCDNCSTCRDCLEHEADCTCINAAPYPTTTTTPRSRRRHVPRPGAAELEV